jgi:uncharacterized protein YyaL (SSP411 family)
VPSVSPRLSIALLALAASACGTGTSAPDALNGVRVGERDGRTPYTNRLAAETSPYLQLHAHDPVDWFPWGTEAFEKARREGKVIFLSIGYSTCHWCHVMRDESFSNAEIAALMNGHFVSIKVDHEERPDVDRLYQSYATSVSDGGWPLSLFLTPDLKPFAAAAYLPPEDRDGEAGFRTLLERVRTVWDTDRPAALRAAADGATTVELHARGAVAPAGAAVPAGTIDETFRDIAGSYDPVEGGFGTAPKFPRPVVLGFLLRYHARTGNPDALEMTLTTLRAMARGGIHDQLGGGFHRYVIDREWRVPHFEKMLYDQAQLATAYTEAYQATTDPLFEEVARATLDYLLDDMRDAGGGFHAAEDADSPPSAGGRAEEGTYYLWTASGIRRALGRVEGDVFVFHYGADDTARTLSARHTVAETAARFGRSERGVTASLDASRRALRAARAARPRPARDDKVLVSWNGLAISAFARAAQVFDEPRYLDAAQGAAAFVRARMYAAAPSRLVRRYRGGRADIDALLEDYAFLIQGLLDLYEASFQTRWLTWALELQRAQDRLFLDTDGGGYFSTRADASHVIARAKGDYDGAEPAANSVSTLNLLRLWQITGRRPLLERADGTLNALSARLARSGAAMPQLVSALDYRRSTPRQVVIAGNPAAADTRALLRLVHRRFMPNKILLLADGGAGQDELAALAPYVRDMTSREGRATIYVCERYVCRLPASDPVVAAQLLDAP